MIVRPFCPSPKTVNIAVSASSQAVKLTDTDGVNQVRVANDGSATVWIAFGQSGVSASASTSMPIASGSVEVLTLPIGNGAPVYAAAIAAGATGTVYFTVGAGI